MAVIVTACLWQLAAGAEHLINTMRFGVCLWAVLAMSGFLRGGAPAVGIVNAVDGDVSINGVRVLGASSASVEPGKTIVKGQDRTASDARRVPADRSFGAVTLELSSANRVQISLGEGECMVEAVEILRPGVIVVVEKGSAASIRQAGMYDFNAKRGTIGGSADVIRGGKQVSVKKGESANVRKRPLGGPFYAPGRSLNYIPAYPGGDSYLYGSPVLSNPGVLEAVPAPVLKNSWPTVPLTAPGVPGFPASHR